MTDHNARGHSASGGGHVEIPMDLRADDHTAEMGHGGVGKYVAVFIGLCVLTALSFGIANSPLKHTPEITWVMMMAVSCAKAMLVILFFMHLKWEANWKYVLTIPASIMSIFLVLMLVPDVGLRGRHYTQERLLHAAEPNSAAGQGDASTKGEKVAPKKSADH